MIDRIAILGGSSVYTPEFILSLIAHNVNVKEIALFGRPGKKLDTVAGFCERLLHRSGFPAAIVPTPDLTEAIRGAKYIVNHIRVGGMRARLRDEKLPTKQGMVGDESIGAGGFANAMRTLPVVLDIARRIEELNPEATLINITNPMGLIVEALLRYTTLKVVGVCDLPSNYIRKVAAILNRQPEELDVDYIGINHIGWIQDVKVDGRSYMGYVLEKLEKDTEDSFDHDLINLFRMIPIQTVGLFFHTDQVVKRQQSTARFRAEILYEAEQHILRLYEDKHLCDIPDLTRERNAVWYDQIIVPLIQAFENKNDCEIVLCVRNDGAIRDLPENSSVEVPVKVSRRGAKPRKVGSCPHFMRGLIHAVKESERLTIEAAVHNSYEHALQALAIHPLVPSVDTARKFLDRFMREEGVELR